MDIDDWEDRMEAAMEHRSGCHEGGCYIGCPVCDEIPDEQMMQTPCDKWCGNTVMMSAKDLRADVDHLLCVECRSGLNDWAYCVDCDMPFRKDELLDREVITETRLIRMIEHQYVCVRCY